MSLQDDLDRIAEMQGKPPIDGSRIEGFGPGASPAPAWSPPVSTADDWPEEDLDQPPSPLIPRKTPSVPQDGLSGIVQALTANPARVSVWNDRALFQGREVTLKSQEQAGIEAIILRAIQRTVRDQIRELSALLPKRARRKSLEPARKRGRPRKAASDT